MLQFELHFFSSVGFDLLLLLEIYIAYFKPYFTSGLYDLYLYSGLLKQVKLDYIRTRMQLPFQKVKQFYHMYLILC
jgi:hypothetical protein